MTLNDWLFGIGTGALGNLIATLMLVLLSQPWPGRRKTWPLAEILS